MAHLKHAEDCLASAWCTPACRAAGRLLRFCVRTLLGRGRRSCTSASTRKIASKLCTSAIKRPPNHPATHQCQPFTLRPSSRCSTSHLQVHRQVRSFAGCRLCKRAPPPQAGRNLQRSDRCCQLPAHWQVVPLYVPLVEVGRATARLELPPAAQRHAPTSGRPRPTARKQGRSEK